MWRYISTDELYHYKYLKKVKSSSGKIRYIYDESDLKTAEKNINNLENLLKDNEGKIKYTDKSGTHHIITPKKDGDSDLSFNYSASPVISAGGSSNKKTDPQTLKDKMIEKGYLKFREIREKHNKEKFKDIPKRIISRGIGFVNKILYDIEDKWIK